MKRTMSLAIASLLLTLSAHCENWAQWRGPNFNGSTTEKGLPSTWTKADALWTLPMTGPSASTPVIWGDHVFVSTADIQDSSLHALCLDRKSGKVLWDKKVGEGRISSDEKSNFASSSPVVDAKSVYFFYANGALVAYSHDGKEIWSRSITKEYGDFAFQWTFSSSPTLYEGKLYLQVLQRDVPVHGRGKTDGPIESFLLALDPETGKTLWRQLRGNSAVGESKEAYSTPIPFENKGHKEILIAGGDCLTAHDPESGKELWRWATWNPGKIGHWRLVPSPVAGAGLVLVSAPKGDPVYAIKDSGSGTLTDAAVAWKTDQKREVSTDVPTPLFYQDDFFVLSDVRKTL
ncbi:MAG: hypothetical protein JWM04_2020, partial [Verrucomicrobiales bacterium]|nr:hypothetical protein [Verrucomicrobiales bacterium]